MMTKRATKSMGLAAMVCLAVVSQAGAAFHLWRINEVFSNADGRIQFIEFQECCGFNNEHFLAGVELTTNAHSFVFPSNLPHAMTADRFFIVGTAAFAALPGAPTPDYIIPDGFVDVTGDFIALRSSGFPFDSLTFNCGNLPIDGINSLNRNLTTGVNSPRNYADVTGSVVATLPSCTIDFESACPSTSPQCGASFSGGDGCDSGGPATCSSSGLFSYKITTAAPLTITFSADVRSLEMFFAHQGASSSGEMRFFDAVAGGNEVADPLLTNGDCLSVTPAMQRIAFPAAVRRVEVVATGGTVWIDDFRVSPISNDCNANGTADHCEMAADPSKDCNGNGALDVCEFPGCIGLLAGDVNCDSAANGADVQDFLETLLSGIYACQADVNQDGVVDEDDIDGFVTLLLSS